MSFPGQECTSFLNKSLVRGDRWSLWSSTSAHLLFAICCRETLHQRSILSSIHTYTHSHRVVRSSLPNRLKTYRRAFSAIHMCMVPSSGLQQSPISGINPGGSCSKHETELEEHTKLEKENIVWESRAMQAASITRNLS